MKKSSIIVLALVIVVAIGGISYAILHKSNKPTVSASTTGSTTPVNNTVLLTKTSASFGQYLAEPNGKPLYTYGGDSNGVSNCTGTCLSSWPAYQDTGSTTSLPTGVSTIKRTDNGQIQYTYNGMPLYTFVGDTNNQVTGNGVSNFTVAKPSTSTTTSNNSSSSSSNSGYQNTSSSGSW
jgi:predicted lipoprotein with Yx(FWY)xxD motif